jgi:hypothetical protein
MGLGACVKYEALQATVSGFTELQSAVSFRGRRVAGPTEGEVFDGDEG